MVFSLSLYSVNCVCQFVVYLRQGFSLIFNHTLSVIFQILPLAKKGDEKLNFATQPGECPYYTSRKR